MKSELFAALTAAVLLPGTAFLPASAHAGPPLNGAIEQTPEGGLKLDIGRFTPYARGLRIDIGPKRDGERSVDVQIRSNGHIPVDLDVSVNPELRGPAYAERPPEEPLNLGPEEDLLGEPADPDALGEPDANGPQLFEPDSPPVLESPPSPDEENNSDPVPLDDAPEPISLLNEDATRESEASIVQVNAETPAPKPYFGVSVKPISDALAAQFQRAIPRNSGLHLTMVGEGSPAEQAGLQKHDIVVAVDGQPVGTLQELAVVVHAHQPGDKVPVMILRASQLQQIDVTLGTRDIQTVSGTNEPETVSSSVPAESDVAGSKRAPRTLLPVPNELNSGADKPIPPPVPVSPDRSTPPAGEELAPADLPRNTEYYSPRRSIPPRSANLGTPTDAVEIPSR